MKQRRDKKFKAKLRTLKIGDVVLVLKPRIGTSMSHKFEGSYKVIERLGNLSYKLCNTQHSTQSMSVHLNRLKAYCWPNIVDSFHHGELTLKEELSVGKMLIHLVSISVPEKRCYVICRMRSMMSRSC